MCLLRKRKHSATVSLKVRPFDAFSIHSYSSNDKVRAISILYVESLMRLIDSEFGYLFENSELHYQIQTVDCNF